MNYSNSPAMSILQPQKARCAVLIDPEERNVIHITPLLDWFNYLVFSFSETADAVAATTIIRPDVIIVSMDLNEIKIQECMRQLRQRASTAAVPVIGTISGDEMAMKLRCFENGAVGFLRHPVDLDALYNALQVATEKNPRFGMRIQTELPVRLLSAASRQYCKTYAQDLSERGAFIRMAPPDPVGTDVFVEFNVAGKDIRTGARVKHSGRTGIRPHFEPGIGIHFADISRADQAYIKQYVIHEVLKEVTLRANCR